jgi:multidrug efflux pump subunit AcrA (membrane-fusion protein)
VVENEGEKIVYVPLSGEEFRRQEVKLGGEYGGKVAVLEGLKAGETYVGPGKLTRHLCFVKPK